MKTTHAVFALFAGALLTQCAQPNCPLLNQRLPTPPFGVRARGSLSANVRQLTFGGDNAEAYWAFNNDALVYQTTQPQAGIPCDRIFVMPLDAEATADAKRKPVQVSNGLGRTTCPYFLPGDSVVVFASTHAADSACPEVPERGPEGRYVWPIYDSYDMYLKNLNTGETTAIAVSDTYDAEATVSPKGDRMVFTSTRDGTSTSTPATWTGKMWFASPPSWVTTVEPSFHLTENGWCARLSPSTPEEVAKYNGLLSKGMVEPTSMELFVARTDGSEMRQITELGGANWAPFFHPDGKRILFSSNHATGRFPFNIYMVDVTGENLTQITYDEAFDSFPMFSPDGTKLAFSSNRNNGRTRNTNLFVADWVE